jgi:DNA primase
MPPAARATELDGLVEHFRCAQSRQTPESEYAALMAKMKGGQRLSPEEKQRLNDLALSLGR